jgi:CHAT domain-containing protein/tetratricopeptide (TPR) repeat protein
MILNSRKRAGFAALITLLLTTFSLAGSARADEELDALAELESQYSAHWEAKRYDQAIAVAEELVERARRNFADNAKLRIITLNYLGRANEIARRFDEAAKAYAEIIEVNEKEHGPNHTDVADAVNELANFYYNTGELAKSEALYLRGLEIREKVQGPEHPNTAMAYHNLAGVYMSEGRYAEAETYYRRALAIREQTIGLEHPDAIETLNNLGLIMFHQARYAESEKFQRQALAARKKEATPNHQRIADALNNLGNVFYAQGIFAEAESFHKQALEIRLKALGPQHADVGQSLHNLGLVYMFEDRYADAKLYLEQGLAVREQALGPAHPDVGDSLKTMGDYNNFFGNYKESEAYYARADKIFKQAFGDEHPRVASCRHSLGVLYQELERFAEAEASYQSALEIWRKVYGGDHPAIGNVYYKLGQLRLAQKRLPEALEFATRAIDIHDRFAESPTYCSSDYKVRAEINWGLGKTADAIADLMQAIELTERQRGLASGDEQTRSAGFERASGPFEMMVGWQTELGHIDEAYAVLERGRARSLIDQLHTQGIDLLADVPREQADKLRSRDAQWKRQVSALQGKLDLLGDEGNLSAGERERQRGQLIGQMAQAQAELVEVYRDMRNASPAYRLAVSQDYRPLPLTELKSWVAAQDAVLIEYLVGTEASFVLVVSPSETTLTRIVLSDEQAKACGVEAGPLTVSKLDEIWQIGDASIVQLLGKPEPSAALNERSALLWELLVPASARELLVGGKCQRLYVVPDGRLSSLPFDALIVERGEQPKYLVDVGPATIYAPSATVLVNLATRTSNSEPSAQPVLTVADAVYGSAAPDAARSGRRAGGRSGGSSSTSARSRYGLAGGELQPLPFTATESTWVRENFTDRGVKAVGLRGAKATEVNVRGNVAGREILHFACHGLVDQTYGNFFGALALTPGRAGTGTDDDGFLTLPEIYALKLSGCELTILSACQTNVGPQQRGEGLYGLSRGFLVAGSRRVVASNWLVDDEAAATMMSVFCSAIAKSKELKEPVDYAESLRAARRRIRQDERWQSPYYWATFVLIGPR